MGYYRNSNLHDQIYLRVILTVVLTRVVAVTLVRTRMVLVAIVIQFLSCQIIKRNRALARPERNLIASAYRCIDPITDVGFLLSQYTSLNSTGDYACIDAKDSIAAIYFGLKFPKEMGSEIIDILKGRKWVNENSAWDETKPSIVNIKEEYPVEFFQMVIDDIHFGKLKAVKIEDI